LLKSKDLAQKEMVNFGRLKSNSAYITGASNLLRANNIDWLFFAGTKLDMAA